MELNIIAKNGQRHVVNFAHMKTVDDLLQQVAKQTNLPAETIRLIYAGKELKPKSAKLNSFNIGKFGNFSVHLSSTCVEVPDSTPSIPTTSSTKSKTSKKAREVLDLTENNVATSSSSEVIDLTSPPVSPRGKKRKAEETPTEKRAARYRSSCPQAISQRIERALHQRLYLINQTDESHAGSLCKKFAVLGSTGNVYDVRIEQRPSCSCPDAGKGDICKHILFVMIKVLRMRYDSNLIYQKALLQSELRDIFSTAQLGRPSAVQAPKNVITAYKTAVGIEEVPTAETPEVTAPIPSEDDECPICFELVLCQGSKEALSSCVQCRNSLHRDCAQRWLQRSATCPFCRSDWAPAETQSSTSTATVRYTNGYMNLSQVSR